MYITVIADIEVPDELTDFCPNCSKSEYDDEHKLLLVMDPDHEPCVFHWLDGAEDMVTIKASYKCAECGTVVQYDDNYYYANSDKEETE